MIQILMPGPDLIGSSPLVFHGGLSNTPGQLRLGDETLQATKKPVGFENLTGFFYGRWLCHRPQPGLARQPTKLMFRLANETKSAIFKLESRRNINDYESAR
jgi:hypothetical protein